MRDAYHCIASTTYSALSSTDDHTDQLARNLEMHMCFVAHACDAIQLTHLLQAHVASMSFLQGMKRIPVPDFLQR